MDVPIDPQHAGLVRIYENGMVRGSFTRLDADVLGTALKTVASVAIECFGGVRMVTIPFTLEKNLKLDHRVPLALVEKQFQSDESVVCLPDAVRGEPFQRAWTYHGIRYEYYDERLLRVIAPVTALAEFDKVWEYVKPFYQAAFQERLAAEELAKK